MKKFLFLLFIGIVSFAAVGNHAFSQNSEKSAVIDSKNFISSIRHLASSEIINPTGINGPDEKNMNARVVKDFQIRFKQVDDARWFADPKGGFVSYFVRDSFGNRVFYDQKGRWLHSLILYRENGLPRELRARIKSTYFDFAIIFAEEVQTPEATGYVVYLEDESTIRILKLNQDGDVQTDQELEKGGSSL